MHHEIEEGNIYSNVAFVRFFWPLCMKSLNVLAPIEDVLMNAADKRVTINQRCSHCELIPRDDRLWTKNAPKIEMILKI